MAKKKRLTRTQKRRALRSPIAKNLTKQKQIREARRKQFKKGTHPQMWRTKLYGGAFARLGPLRALGNHLIYNIGIKDQILKLYKQNKVHMSKKLIYEIMKDFLYVPTKRYMTLQINSLAPSKSNDLRKSMLKAITDRGDSIVPQTVVINTKGIEYGGPVNNMPTDNLQAPKAIKWWYNMIRKNSRMRSRRNFEGPFLREISKLFTPADVKLFKTMSGRSVTSYSLASSLFTHKFK